MHFILFLRLASGELGGRIVVSPDSKKSPPGAQIASIHQPYCGGPLVNVESCPMAPAFSHCARWSTALQIEKSWKGFPILEGVSKFMNAKVTFHDFTAVKYHEVRHNASAYLETNHKSQLTFSI